MRITTHPGEMLLEEFMKPNSLSANALARHIHVPANRISDMIRGRRGMTADTARRLAAYFGNTPQFWINLQTNYDLSVAESQHAAEYAEIKAMKVA